MNFKYLVNKAKLTCVKHSPEILMGVGIVGTVGGAVLACRATAKKVVPRKMEYDRKIIVVTKDAEEGKIEEAEAKKICKKETASYALDVAKSYAIPVTLEVASIVCIVASNNIMRKRLAGVTAAFATVSAAFDSYRERVKERYGEEEEMSIYLNEKKVEIETTDEKGKTKKETITVADPDISTIGRYLTSKNGNFSLSESFMDNVVRMKDSYLTDKMINQGFITLNDIYYEWDFEQDTEQGITVGQVANPNECGNCVHTTWKKVKIPNEYGNYEDAYYLDWPGLEIIYGKGAGHRSIE